MTAAPAFAEREMRTTGLAMAFQEVFSLVLRTRSSAQRVENADAFRATLRKTISAAMQDVAAMGYGDEASKLAIHAVVGFADECLLNTKDPAFADWARRPLQEEMFGGRTADEDLVHNVAELLDRPETPEVADVLELHALCMLLGYHGGSALGGRSEIQTLIGRMREKINSIHGGYTLFRPIEMPSEPSAPKRDPWVKRLAIAAAALAILTLLACFGYVLILRKSMPANAMNGASTFAASQSGSSFPERPR